LVDDGGGRWSNLNLEGEIRPTGGDIIIVVGICSGSGGVDNCNSEWRKARQQKFARRRRDGDGSGSSSVSDCDPKQRMVQQQKLAWRRRQDGNGRDYIINCNPERRTAQQQKLAWWRNGDGNSGGGGGWR
jgi:hypothetical protein